MRSFVLSRAAVCAACANKNPIPNSRIPSPTRANGTSIRTPSASSTSADPLRELAARLPCFATRAPPAAASIAAAVEILNASKPSPPVPHVSIMFFGRISPSVKTSAACRRITVANPASSSTKIGLALSASKNRTISGVSMRPHSNSSITASAPPRVNTCPDSICSIKKSIVFAAIRGVLAPLAPSE